MTNNPRMSLFYEAAYRLGFAPWEHAASHPPAARQIAELFDREESERGAPPGRALDLGCGRGHWSLVLARRGWEVTGVELVGKAARAAAERVRNAGVSARIIQGDITDLTGAGVGDGFGFVWDFGSVHGLSEPQRRAVGRQVSAVTTDDASVLLLAWAPGRRFLAPRGASREELEAAFAGWAVVDEQPFDVSGLPKPLRKVDPRVYRLRRA